jgi:hypothetical protein
MVSLPSRDASQPVAVAPAAGSAEWWRLLPSWPLWLGLAGFVRLMAQPGALLNDPDTYLHLAAGNWMIAHAALVRADPFSFTLAGAPWLAGEWLGELILTGLFRLGGWTGLVIVTAACFAVSLGILGHFLVRRVGALPALIAALIGAALVMPHVVARAHVLAMPLLVWWSGALFAARDKGNGPPWRLLPLVALWANLHASVLFGVALTGWLGMEAVAGATPAERRAELRRWGGFSAAAAGMAVLTPHPMGTLLQPFRLMTMPALQASFGEWQPPVVAQFPALELWLLGALALGFMLEVRLRWSRLVLLVALVHLSLSHVRHADLLGLVGPLVIASGVGAALDRHRATLSGLAVWRGVARFAGPITPPGLAVTVALAVVAALPLMVAPLTRASDRVTPRTALAAAREAGVAGPVFNSEAFGGYLDFVGVPSFIDGRAELFGNSFLADDVAAERGDAAALTRLLDRYRIGWALLVPQAGAVAVFDRLAGWRRVYADRFAVVFARGQATPR